MNIVFEITQKKFRVREIPIIFSKRKYGISKMPNYQIILAMINLFYLIIKKITNN